MNKSFSNEELEDLADNFLDNYLDPDIPLTPDEINLNYNLVKKIMVEFYRHCLEK
jgi:hypothetical protein